MFPCTCLDLSKNIGSADQIIGVKRKVAITDEYIGVPGGIIGARARVPQVYAYIPVYSLTHDVWNWTGLQLFFTLITDYTNGYQTCLDIAYHS